MKLILLLTAIGTLQLHATAVAQRISLSERSVSLDKIFAEIRKQSDVDFVVRSNQMKKTHPVSISVKNRPLEEVLKTVFQGQPVTYLIANGTIIVKDIPEAPPRSVFKQQSLVTGTVRDSIDVLVGVSVRVKGKPNIGTATDANGKYVLSVSANDVLVFSFIGYQYIEVPIEGREEVDVTLTPDAASLDEVVVLGYGQTQSKQSVTGAISSIQSKELKQSPVANLSNALAGRLPGLITAQRSGRPGDDYSQLFIRGINTTGNTNPLVVIDGLPRGDANLGQLDVNEIESISILKDASSTALYGIQGANGIILVTTKRGREGAPNIQLNLQYALQEPTNFPRFLDSYRSGVLQNEAAVNDGLAPVWTEQELEYFRTGLKPYDYPNVDWYEEAIRKLSPQKSANVNISGGSPYVKYFVSGSYIRQEPVYKHAKKNIYDVNYKYDRFNFRSNVDVRLDKNMDLQVDLASRLENRTGPSLDRANNEFYWVLLSQMTNHLTPVLNPDGSIASGNMREDFYNIYGVMTSNGYLDAYWHSTNGSVSLKRKLDVITPGLTVRGLFTFENYGDINFALDQEFDSFRYRTVPGSPTGVYTQHRAATSLQRSGLSTGQRYYYYDLKAMYDRQFDRHTVSGLILFNRNYRSQSGDLPRVYQGYVGRLAYDFDKKYFVEINAGYNGSENFPPGKRYGFFPALSAAWVISNEKFMDNQPVFNLLKLRASHGYVGNDQIGSGRWLYMSDYVRTDGFVFGSVGSAQGGYQENRIGNTAITWEKAQKSNLGIETAYWNNRLQVNIDLFRELRTDILTAAGSIPDYLGITASLNRNLGRILNRGIEGEVNLNANAGNVGIFAKVNYQFVKNKVLEMDEPKLAYAYQSAVGYPVGYELGYVAEGLFRNQADIDQHAKQNFAPLIPGDIKYRDIDKNNVIDEADRVMIPMLNVPTNYFGATLGIDYKGFDVSILFQGALGGRQMYSSQIMFNYRESYRPIHLNRWTPENAAGATFPALHLSESNMANNFMSSTYWIRKTDYLKLKNAEIGYRFDTAFLKKARIKNARIYLNGMNLYSWDNVHELGVDPESNTGGRWGWQPYPIMRVFNAGVTLNF